MSLKAKLLTAAAKKGIRLIKGGQKSFGKIKKPASFSKSGVDSAVSKAKLPPVKVVKPKSLGTIKPKTISKGGIESAGAAKNAMRRASSGNRVLAATAAAVGAGVAYNMSKSSGGSASAPAAKKKAPAAKKKAPVAKKAVVAIAPYEPKSVVAKSKPRAASFTPRKKTKTSVSSGKKKTGYVKSNRSLRAGSRRTR